MVKKPRPKAPKVPKPRNVAAKALAEGQYRPKVVADPRAYKRHPKHPAPPPDDDDGDKD